MDLKLAWFDQHLKDLHTETSDWQPVRIFTMGQGSDDRAVLGSPGDGSEYPGRVHHGGYWRSEPDWPLPGTAFTPYYLHADGSLSPDAPLEEECGTTSYTYDPMDPVPTLGGGISAADMVMAPGGFDQRGRPGVIGCRDTLPLNTRRDVLTFQTGELDRDTEVTGPIEMRLWASSSALDTDFTAKLIDVYPPSDNFPDGLAFNITDSIIRAGTATAGTPRRTWSRAGHTSLSSSSTQRPTSSARATGFGSTSAAATGPASTSTPTPAASWESTGPTPPPPRPSTTSPPDPPTSPCRSNRDGPTLV